MGWKEVGCRRRGGGLGRVGVGEAEEGAWEWGGVRVRIWWEAGVWGGKGKWGVGGRGGEW